MAANYQALSKAVSERLEAMREEAFKALHNTAEINRDEAINLEKFWEDLHTQLNKMTKTSAGFCILFLDGKAPEFNCAKSYVDNMLREVTALHELVLKFPSAYGHSVHKKVLSGYRESIRNLKSLITSGCNLNDTEIKATMLAINSRTWATYTCLSSLPRCNAQSVCADVGAALASVGCALEEVAEAYKEGFSAGDSDSDDDTESHKQEWSDGEKRVVAPAVSLLKCVQLLGKRVTEGLQSATHTRPPSTAARAALWRGCDDIGACVRVLPETADDLVLALYEAAEFTAATEQVTKLSQQITAVVAAVTAAKLPSPDTPQAMEFVLKALQHNRDKFTSALNCLK